MKAEAARTFTLGRVELETSPEADAGSLIDDTVKAARTVVSRVERGLSALLLGPSEMRRVDFWASNGVLVAHGHAADPDLPVAGSVHEGKDHTILVLAQLLMRHLGGPSQATSAYKSEFDGIGDLVEFVSAGASGDPHAPRCCVLNLKPTDSSAEVLVVCGAELRWSLTRQDRAFSLESGNMGQLWGEVVRIAHLVDGADSVAVVTGGVD